MAAAKDIKASETNAPEKNIAAKKRRFDSLEQEAFINLWRTYDCLKAVEAQLFSQYELSAQQYNALRLLRSVHPGTMPTLALGKRLISRCPDTTRMLDRLEKRELILRQRIPENRRVVEVAIMPAGLELLDQMNASVRAMHKAQLGHMRQADQKLLVQLLRQARAPHEDASCDWLEDESQH